MGLVFVTDMEEYDDYHASFYEGVLDDLPKEMERRSRPSTSLLSYMQVNPAYRCRL
jgi:hypothetical protein